MTASPPTSPPTISADSFGWGGNAVTVPFDIWGVGKMLVLESDAGGFEGNMEDVVLELSDGTKLEMRELVLAGVEAAIDGAAADGSEEVDVVAAACV